MNKIIILSILILMAQIVTAQETSFYSFKTKTLDGNDFDFSSLRGKKVLVVNTASKCGFTPQYATLEKIYEKYKDNNFVVIGFPANDFLRQEPGTNEEIAEFCQKNYGVTFPIMQKISVKGDNMHPVYRWLTSKAENGRQDSKVTWNFQKYMIDETGNLVGYASPNEKPDSEKIVSWIEGN